MMMGEKRRLSKCKTFYSCLDTETFILSNIGSLEKLANTYIFAKLQERTHIYCSLKQKWTLEAGKQQHFKSFLNILPWP